MNQKDAVNDIKERLGEYTRLLREIDNQYERLGLMEMTMAAPPGLSMTGMPRGSGAPSDRTGLMVMRKMELEEQIKETIAEEQKERASIEAMIQRVKHPDERAVLRLRYFDRADWDGILRRPVRRSAGLPRQAGQLPEQDIQSPRAGPAAAGRDPQREPGKRWRRPRGNRLTTGQSRADKRRQTEGQPKNDRRKKAVERITPGGHFSP